MDNGIDWFFNFLYVKKGNQWHFGMKAHIGVDAKSGLTHSLVTTAANEHDLNQLGNLLHGEEQFVLADAGYQGAPQREELAEVDVDWLIAERPGKVKTLKQHPRKNKTAINIEYMKASIRAGGGAPVSHHQAAVRLRESQIQGAAEKR